VEKYRTEDQNRRPMINTKHATVLALLFGSSVADTGYIWVYNEDKCPDDTEVPSEECLLALQSLTIGFDNITARDHLKVEDYSYTPCGCFLQNGNHDGKEYSVYTFDNGPLQGDTGCIGHTPVNGWYSTLICKAKASHNALHTNISGINNWFDANAYCTRQGGGPCGSWCTQSIEIGLGCGSNEEHLCCPLEFPYQSKDTPYVCYNSTDWTNASNAPCGSWCTNDINVGSGCSGSNADRICAKTGDCPIEFPYPDQLVQHVCHNTDVNANGGQRLATRVEWCPDGITPFRGFKQGMDQWAAISDGENNWVQVGNIDPDRTCKTHFEVASDDPTWGLNSSQYFESKSILCVSSNIPSSVPITSMNPSNTPSRMPANNPTTTPSFAPSTMPSLLPSVYCADSKFKLKIKDTDGNAIEIRSCSWASRDAEIRCAYDNVNTHCPVTCGACESCADSQAEFFFTKEYNTCAIASKKNCRIKDFSHTCRATCGTCPSTVSSPTPFVYCADSTFRFKTQDSDGNTTRKICSWVSRDAEIRCKYDNVSTHCPVTCGTCEHCSDSEVEFLFRMEYNTCGIASMENCRIEGFSHTCRAACGTCPSSVPSIVPSSILSDSLSRDPSLAPSRKVLSPPSDVLSYVPSAVPSADLLLANVTLTTPLSVQPDKHIDTRLAPSDVFIEFISDIVVVFFSGVFTMGAAWMMIRYGSGDGKNNENDNSSNDNGNGSGNNNDNGINNASDKFREEGGSHCSCSDSDYNNNNNNGNIISFV